MRRRRGTSNAVPLGSLLLAALVVVAVLPSALRPPPDEANQSAELSPDAPPDEDPEAIIQTLHQAASRTAGATGEPEEPEAPPEPDEAPTSTTTAVEEAPSRGQCFGDPPRQTDSFYSPPCKPAFVGDNGGATYPNVTGDLVRVGYHHVFGMPAQRGPIAFEQQPGESETYRTARVIQAYFNENYELYGRRVQLVALRGDPTDDPGARAQAQQAVTEDQVFVSTNLHNGFCEEMARLRFVCFNANAARQAVYEERAPFWWSYQMEVDKVNRITAEYVCKKLVGRDADHAAGRQRGEPRKIGVITESSATTSFRRTAEVTSEIERQCGYTVTEAAEVEDSNPLGIATAVGRMSSQGVTTIVLQSQAASAFLTMSAADALTYLPEWVLVNSYGLDISDGARIFLPPNQLPQVFGLSGWELPRRFEASDCYRAYKSIDPAGEPNAQFCGLLWISIEQMVNGIQEAGPELTPETFREGLYGLPLDPPRAGWAIAGRYGPGNHSFVESLLEMWWDPGSFDPDGGEPGTYCYTAEGRRWRLGELDEEQRAFRECVTGYTG